MYRIPSRFFTERYSMIKLVAMSVSDFLNKKLLEWQFKEGKRKTLDEFAAYLGVKRTLLSMWMNGSRHPGPKYRKRLIELYGDEAAEALGEDPRLFFINQNWENASEELQRSIHEQLQREINKNEVQRLHSERKKTSTK